MTMTLRQFINWAQTDPTIAPLLDIAEINVMEATPAGGWEGGYSVDFDTFDPAKHVEVMDMRGNEYVKPGAPYYNKVFIRLGSKD